MPLLDHFRPPLSVERHWEAFHARWATAIADALNANLLPPDYFAEPHVHVGSRVEVDVATFEGHAGGTAGGSIAGGAVATATLAAPSPAWSPPAPALSVPAVFPDSIEVLVYSTEAGPTLVAAVELVSPGNKDRREERRAFAAKCAAYLQQGVGLVVIDVVTTRQANLHDELMELLAAAAYDRSALLLSSKRYELYAVAYRPSRSRRGGEGALNGATGGDGTGDRIDMWPAPLAVGQPLPFLPLPLDKGRFVPLDLESAYTEARQRSRLA